MYQLARSNRRYTVPLLSSCSVASKQTGLFRKAGNEEEIVALKNDMKKGDYSSGLLSHSVRSPPQL